MKPIQKIVVPTDFSECSKDAFHVALDIAERFGASVEVAHFYVLPVDNNLPEGRTFIYTEREYMLTLEEKMDKFIHHDFHNSFEENVATKVKVTYKIEIGFPGTKIVEFSSRPDVNLIVMGASGDHPNFARFFGSIASEIAADAECPVLLIPFGRRFARFDDIMYSCSEDSNKKHTLGYTLEWAKKFNARLHFVHSKNINKSFDTYTSKDTYEQMKDFDTDVEMRFETVIDSLPWRGLYTYADVERIDMMIIVTKHRSFFQNLVHNSLTENLSTDAHLPLLVLHSDDKNVYGNYECF